MLALIVGVIRSGQEPVWALVFASLGSGSLVGLLSYLQARRLAPAQRKELEASAQKAAVDTVDAALDAARDRITVLEGNVESLTKEGIELRLQLKYANQDRERVSSELDIMLSERARLQQQVTDLHQRIGSRRAGDLWSQPPEAIVMVDSNTGVIRYANEGVLPLFGWLPNELINQKLDVLIPEESRERHKKLRANYSAAPVQREMGRGGQFEIRAALRRGGSMPVDISLHPTGDGRVLALIKRREEPLPEAADSSHHM